MNAANVTYAPTTNVAITASVVLVHNSLTYVAHTANRAFKLIAEPRITRVFWFFIYTVMTVGGIIIIATPPFSMREILGEPIVAVLGVFVGLGALMGGFAVLPGIWWLERIGLVSLGTGLGMYFVFVVNLGAPPMTFVIGSAFILCLIQRWMEIRKFQLAPKKG